MRQSNQLKESKINFPIRSLITVFTFAIILIFGAAVLTANPQPDGMQKAEKHKVKKHKVEKHQVKKHKAKRHKIKKKRINLREKNAQFYKMLMKKKIKDGRHLLYTTGFGIKCYRLVKHGKIGALVFFNKAGKKLKIRIIPGSNEPEQQAPEQEEVGEGEGWIDCDEGTHSVTIIVCDEDELGNEIEGSCVEITDCVPD